MLKHDRHRQGTDFVEPDLPSTPMVDMSFQLLAFFIMTFKPADTEGQIALHDSPFPVPRETVGRHCDSLLPSASSDSRGRDLVGWDAEREKRVPENRSLSDTGAPSFGAS